MSVHPTITRTLAAGLIATAVAAAPAQDRKTLLAVDFTATPAPITDVDKLRTHTASKAVLRWSDGSTSEHPLEYRVLFKNTDKVGASPHAAGQLYDVDGNPLRDPNGDFIVAETPDANSLLNVDGKLFLVTHYEYDWILGSGESANNGPAWYRRMPMSMTLTRIEQQDNGDLVATAQRPIDFSTVHGLWTPCFGSQTPWNTHLGAEEDYDLFYVAASGNKRHKQATEGLKVLTEVYFQGRRQANPYDYGYITEVKVSEDGSTRVIKHYNMGRASWEQALIMPDRRTVYFGDDGTHVGLFMFVADNQDDLSAGTLYAARWFQVSGTGAGAADLGWVRLSHNTRAYAEKIIDSGIGFDDIFATTNPKANPDWEPQGFRAIRAGHTGNEYLRLKPAMEQAAGILEPRRYAAYLGATTEFNKMEGLALDPETRHLYLALSYLENGMKRDDRAPADHIRVAKRNTGAVYRISLSTGVSDTGGRAIAGEWVGTAMHAPPALLGKDIPPDALGNLADPSKIANPDNLFFSPKMRTLFIGEDSSTHVNNFLWAYNVDTGKLTRILSLASGAEATGLQVLDNLNGHAYILSNAQHRGQWLKSMPPEVKARLIEAAKTSFGTNDKGVLKYRLEAPVGYIAGIPGID
jgi:secreted PhoX family phosphatase